MLLFVSVCHSEFGVFRLRFTVSLMFQVRRKSFPNPMSHHCISITLAIPSYLAMLPSLLALTFRFQMSLYHCAYLL
ncbi:hypothetical protein M405DRAFT_835289, partial [Rhizopogon salebrosus TDB-379]